MPGSLLGTRLSLLELGPSPLLLSPISILRKRGFRSLNTAQSQDPHPRLSGENMGV